MRNLSRSTSSRTICSNESPHNRTTTGSFHRRQHREVSSLHTAPLLLQTHSPQLVILCHGGNDILRRRDRGALQANLERMIADSRAVGAEVVLLGVPDFGLFLAAADVYAEVATRAGVVLENDVLPDVLADRNLKSDAVHPNAEGYRRIALAVADLLRREGAL